MRVTPRVARFAVSFVLATTAAPLVLEAQQQFVCWPIERGDTASRLAVRLTGSTAALYSDRFQIRDPARAIFVPKSHYERINTHWEACIDRKLFRSASTPAVPADAQPSQPIYDMTFVLRVAVSVTLTLFVCSLVVRYVPDRAIPADMQRVGEQFIAAFVRPLIDPTSNTPPIQARLRFVHHAQRLEICIAPNGDRRYPNLADHKTNLQYDVKRIATLLPGHVIVDNRLRAEGKWVVIPIRRADLKEAGVK